MKLNPIGQNQTEVNFSDKTVFFSYKTPVAAFIPGTGYIKTSKKWSTTTSKHINQWLKGCIASEVDQSVLDSLV
jgi:hypothetical protein